VTPEPDWCGSVIPLLDRLAAKQEECERWVEWARSSRCIYCGTVLQNPLDESQEEADRIKREHVASCEKHPFRAEKARADRLEADRDRLAAIVEGAPHELPCTESPNSVQFCSCWKRTAKETK